MTLQSAGISRRSMVTATTFGVAALGIGGFAAGCRVGSDPTPPQQDGGTTSVDLPFHDTTWLVEPDLVSERPDVPAGFLAYPADPPSVSDGPVGNGVTVSAFCEVTATVPPPMAQNPFWKSLNERLGVTLDITLSPTADYLQKVQTLIAGGSIPDLVQIKPGLPRTPSVLDARFQPLTEVLGGDGVKDYPNLAKIPPYAWKGCVYNNEIYGVPFVLALVSNGLFARKDLLDEAGASDTPGDVEAFMDMCREVTDPRRSRWALCKPESLLASSFGPMFGVPNQWRVNADGSWTRHWETDEFAAALEAVADAWSQGFFHPDAFGSPQDKQWFEAGNVAFIQDGLTAIGGFRRNAAGNPDFDVTLVRPPLSDGGGLAPLNQGTGVYSMTAVAKASPERVREVLETVNWLAAPIGTEEYRFRVYGEEGVHFTLEGTDPVDTDRAIETKIPTSYIGRGVPFIYSPGSPSDTQFQFDFLEAAMPESSVLPTVGLHSETEDAKGAELDSMMSDIVTGILAGRESMSAWAPAVAEWKASGGEQIAAEFAEAAGDV